MDLTTTLQEKPLLANVGLVTHTGGNYHYCLPSLWSLHLYEYHGRLQAAEWNFDLYPGSLTLVPPNIPTEFQVPASAMHYFVHFSLPATPTDASLLSPTLYDVRGELLHFEQAIVTVAQALRYTGNRLRAEIALWNLLWELASDRQVVPDRRHISFEKALSLIDSRLSKPISVNLLAREVGVSRNHLTRLFHQEKGLTVVAYVRQQRAHRAKHLLQNTTMSLMDIASQINSPNQQTFSALVKKETGQPPGYWRRNRE